MLNESDSSRDNRQEKIALLKYTFEQILATQAEQVNGKLDTDNIIDMSSIFQKNTEESSLLSIKNS